MQLIMKIIVYKFLCSLGGKGRPRLREFLSKIFLLVVLQSVFRRGKNPALRFDRSGCSIQQILTLEFLRFIAFENFNSRQGCVKGTGICEAELFNAQSLEREQLICSMEYASFFLLFFQFFSRYDSSLRESNLSLKMFHLPRTIRYIK